MFWIVFHLMNKLIHENICNKISERLQPRKPQQYFDEISRDKFWEDLWNDKLNVDVN